MTNLRSPTRRQAIVTIGAGGLLSLFARRGRAGAASDPPSSNPWSQYQNNAHNTGYVADLPQPTDELAPKWRFARGATPPVYHDGKLIVGDMVGNLHALNGDSGHPEWRYDLGEGMFVRSVPTIVDDTLVVGGVDGHLHAVDPGDGTRKWRTAVPTLEGLPGLVASSPAVYEETVFVCGGLSTHAFDLAEGTQQWEIPTGEVWGRPAVTDDGVYVASWGEELVRLDHESGTVLNEVTTQGQINHNAPTVVDDTVYIGTWDGNVHAITGGSIDWTIETGGAIRESSIATDGERLCVANHNGEVYAFDPVDGTELWRFEGEGEFWNSPAILGETVYIGNRDGLLYGLELETGEQRWQQRFAFGEQDSHPMAPVIVDDTLYVTYQAGTEALAPGDHTVEEIGRTEPPEELMKVQESLSQQRGFITNDPRSSLRILDDPIALTWVGFGVSIAGILLQMYGRQS